MSRILIFVGLLVIVVTIICGLFGHKSTQSLPVNTNPQPISVTPLPSPTPTLTPTPTPMPTLKAVLNDVPFTVQSPFANWKDPRQQDACEEASVLMVMHWVKNQPILSKQAALEEILALSKYQEDNFGGYHDTSAQDTAERLIKGYYHYTNYEVKNINNADEIIAELNQGRVVIVPTNGQALGQPNFTPPGPERHNLVLKSFDTETNQFIVNDPGISQGENWRYAKEVLFNAIRDYPTGDHLPINGIKKDMIVINRS